MFNRNDVKVSFEFNCNPDSKHQIRYPYYKTDPLKRSACKFKRVYIIGEIEQQCFLEHFSLKHKNLI